MKLRKDVFQLTLPVMAEQSFIVLMGMVNTIMAGQLGKEAVSAIGMVDSINNILIAFFSALAVGGTVVVAQNVGRKNLGKTNEAASHALLSGAVLATVVTVLIYFSRTILLGLLFGNAEPIVMDNALIYFNITLLTYPLIALTSIAFGVLRGTGDTKTPMKVSILMNILNVVFSYVLIYGLEIGSIHFHVQIGGFGLKGAAIGIAAARTIGAILVLYPLIKGSKILKINLNRNFKVNRNILQDIFGIGVPSSVESLLFNGGKLLTQVFIVGMGTAATAANVVAGSVFGLINIPGTALSIAATTIVGQYVGRGEQEEAKETLLYITKFASLCLLLISVLIFPFSKFLAGLYTSSEDVILLASNIIKTSAISMPLLWSISFIIPAGLKGAGDAKYTMVVSIFGMWTFRITLGYVLGVPLGLGVMGVWLGMYADWVVRGTLFYLRLRSGKWNKRFLTEDVSAAG